MGFIYILDPGPTYVSGRSVKCFSECAQRTPCIPVHWDWDVGSDLWGWSLGLCILTPPLVTLIHSRASGALVMEGGWGVERSYPEWQEMSGEERAVPGQRRMLTTSSHLPASLMILLTTWPDPTPGSWLQGEAARTGQGCPPADSGPLRWGRGCCPEEGGIQIRE